MEIIDNSRTMRPLQRKLDIGAFEAPRECSDDDDGWIGVDIQGPGECPYCGETIHNILKMDAEALNFPGEYFEEIYSGDCVGKIVQSDKAFDEAFRVLKKDGKFAFHVDIWSLGQTIRQITNRKYFISNIEITNQDEGEVMSVKVEGAKKPNAWA